MLSNYNDFTKNTFSKNMELLYVNNNNSSMNFENTASLLAVSSELFSKNDIITLPSNVKFDYQDVVTVMLHAATSSTNSLESASNDLISKNPTQKIPSADTIFEYG